MSNPTRLVDMHCHLLPGLDDGPASWEESLALAQQTVGDGVTAVVATPHQLGTYSHNSAAVIRPRAQRLQRLLDRTGVPLQVFPGAEIRIEPGLVSRLAADELLSLADHRRHVLLEMPHEVYLPLERLLSECNAAGIVAVLAHPERNLGILARPEVVPPLVGAGCLVQVTAGSLVGDFGAEVRQLANRWIQQGLVHFVASDLHHPRSRRSSLSQGYAAVRHLTDETTAEALCCRNPADLAQGRPILPLHQAVRAAPAGKWFWQRKVG